MKKLISFKNYSFLFVFTFLLFAQISFGTILEKMDTEKLTKKSHLIIIAKVTNIRCEWDEQWKLIFTYVTVSTDQYIKGNSLKNEIEIMFPGGIVGSKRLFVISM